MRNTANWTGRIPRTMSQAFGPYYSRGPIEEPKDVDSPYDLSDAIVIAVCLIGFIVALSVL